MSKPFQVLLMAICIGICKLSLASSPTAVPASGPGGSAQTITSYVARPGRSKPVIAIVGDNGGTELTDFVIPYGVLARADIATVVAVGTRAGPI